MTTSPRRILITGSRDWPDPWAVERALFDVWLAWDCPVGSDAPILVSGCCPTGADRMAEDVWEAKGFPIERHPADWATHGRAAGPLRNKHMVDLGADLCLAFVSGCTSPRCHIAGEHLSHGATGTVRMAREAGIEVRVVTIDGTHVG